jgi:23S rRNA (uridine2552-2'-O)-methyltransferase
MKVKTKSKKVNKAWLNDHVNDPWVKLAAKEGYRARAAYKLQGNRRNLAPDPARSSGGGPGLHARRLEPVCASAASPDGAAVGKLNGTIIALDILPMEPIEGVTFIQGDFREAEVLARLEAAVAGRKADVVVSDMAPNLSGIESVDAARIAHLVELAAGLCRAAPQARRGAGGQAVSRQRLCAAGAAVSRYVSRWSSRSSPRPRATSPQRPFWWASA